MNLRNVLRAYSLLRQLSDDETALLETLRAANDSDRALFVEQLSDKPPQKKSSKKAAGKSGNKSARASSLQQQIQKTTRIDGDSSSDSLCAFVINDATGETCDATKDDAIHDATYSSSHEFQTGKSSAQSAGSSSSANGAGVDSTVNSETQPDEAGVAASGGG